MSYWLSLALCIGKLPLIIFFIIHDSSAYLITYPEYNYTAVFM